MEGNNKTVAEVCAKLKEVANGQNVSNDGLVVEISQDEIWDACEQIEAAHEREIAAKDADIKGLRECLARRSSHLNAILQKALELDNDVPLELRKVMDECIVAEDEAIGLGVFSTKKGSE